MKKSFLFLISLALMSFAINANAEEQKATLLNLNATDNATIFDISANGEWGCGHASDAETQVGISARIWNLQTGECTIIAESLIGTPVKSEANCVSNDGKLVGGMYDYMPAYWNNGTWVKLPVPSKDDIQGTVLDMTIVGADTIMVGWSMKPSYETTACRWINGKLTTTPIITTDKVGAPTIDGSHTLRHVSEDGNIYFGVTNHNALHNKPTAYVINTATNDTVVLDTLFNDEIYFDGGHWEETVISDNGKYVAGMYHMVPENSDLNENNVPFIYDVENKRMRLFNDAPLNSGVGGIDNEGNPYIYAQKTDGAGAGSALATPIREAYLVYNDSLIHLEPQLLKYGITKSDCDVLDTEYDNLLGTIMGVSADGKTIIGCSGATKTANWALRLPENLYSNIDPDAKFDDDTKNEIISNDNLAAYYSNGYIVLSGIVNSIEVYNMTGALVFATDVESAFVPANLHKGIYIVRMNNNKTNTATTSKIVVR